MATEIAILELALFAAAAPEHGPRPYHAPVSASGADQKLEEMPHKTGAGGRPQYYSGGTGKFVRREDDSGTESLTITNPLEFYSPLQHRSKDGKWDKGAGVVSGSEVPTRQPTKNATGVETTKWDEISPEGKARMLARLQHVGAPGFAHIKTPDEAVDYIKHNMLEVHDQAAPHAAAAWKQWYVGANKIAGDMAAQYPSVSHDTASAIIARLSPQKDWDQNVAQAHSLIDALHNNLTITPDLAGRVAVLKAEAGDRSGKGKSGRESNLNLDPHEHMGLVGKKLSDLTDEQAAWAIRANDPNPANKAVQVKADGSYSISENTTGRSLTAWQSYQNIISAVRIYRTPTAASMSKELGQEHKVRSFFNNINAPFSTRHDVTTDTHHYGVGLGIPVGTSHPLIGSGKSNITQSGGNTKDGIKGTYAMFAEATRRAAAERGVLPREMQSIVWEQWRHAYPKASRARGAIERAETAARQYDTDIGAGMNPTLALKRLEAGRAAAREFASKYAPKSGEVETAA